MVKSSHLQQLLSLTLLLFSFPLTTKSLVPQPSFKCTTNSTCKALIGYTPLNSTTLSHIQSLFQVKTLRSLLGVNNLPLSTSPNYVVSANRTVTIPFPCRCSNGSGLSNRVPQYTVVKDDGLFVIANQKFGGLVAYQQIQAVNHIKDANLIKVGQKLWVPLPCSCDDVDGQRVLHYGHVVAPGTTVDGIANEFGTNSETLMKVNGINDPKTLIAGQVLDVPLKVCTSSVSRDSFDYPLLVANNSYVFTAHNCVMCKCDPTNNFTLQCEPTGLKPVDWKTCPVAQCSKDLSLGNWTTSSFSDCSRSTCAYTGFFKNQTILATLVDENTCPESSSDNSGAFNIDSSKGWTLTGFVMLCIQLLMVHRFM